MSNQPSITIVEEAKHTNNNNNNTHTHTHTHIHTHTYTHTQHTHAEATNYRFFFEKVNKIIIIENGVP